MPQKQWKFEGYDGQNLTFEKTLPFENISEGEVKEALRCLISRHLNENEILSCFLPIHDKWHAPHLEIRPTGGKRYGFMTGGSPHYVASIEESN